MKLVKKRKALLFRIPWFWQGKRSIAYLASVLIEGLCIQGVCSVAFKLGTWKMNGTRKRRGSIKKFPLG